MFVLELFELCTELFDTILKMMWYFLLKIYGYVLWTGCPLMTFLKWHSENVSSYVISMIKPLLLTFDLIFEGQDLILRVIFYVVSPTCIFWQCILTPRSSAYHILLPRYNSALGRGQWPLTPESTISPPLSNLTFWG